MNIIRVKTTTSTNAFLKEWASKEDLPEGTTVQTFSQTAGRGQAGNHWEAEPGKNITCSILFYPEFLPVGQNFLLSKVIALGIKDTLEEYISPVLIKWPNDIYIGESKVSGTLIENELTGQVISQTIAGIGVNINQEIFRSDAPNPVSLKQLLKEEIDLDIFLEKMISNVLSWYDCLKKGQSDFIDENYIYSLYRRSGLHGYRDCNGEFRASIQRVENNGQLYLKTDKEEIRTYYFKEVSCCVDNHNVV